MDPTPMQWMCRTGPPNGRGEQREPRAAEARSWTPRGLLSDLSRPAIRVGPIWTRRALLPDRVVDAFFVWASDDPWTDHDGFHLMGCHKVKGGPADLLVKPSVGLRGMPALKRA